MSILCRAWALISVLVVTTASFSQELKKDGILKHPEGQVAAAMTFAPGGSMVVAYVAAGSESEKFEKINWSEVRLLDVASGKNRVLVRAATPAALPGIGANHTIRGFTADSKQLVVTTSDPGGTITELRLDLAEPKKEPEGKGK